LIGLATGIIKRSYECEGDEEESEDGVLESGEPVDDGKFDHRREILREVVFLLPVIIGTIVAFQLFNNNHAVKSWWIDFTQVRVVEGLLGALWGYFVGCAVVWGTRILGTLGFGKEAMGLGDMHLMGAAGAIIGPVFVVLAFFVAPFFGLSWAGYQAFSKKTRQIPYGPFLSMGIFTVIIFHDRVISYMHEMDLYFLY
jgi:leader peptidase (prepilin peptidase)/N-methyltransferase